MVRTVIALQDNDKRWLDEQAAREGVSMTALVRRAVRLLRQHMEREDPPLEELLERTRGCWKCGDGLEYQRRLRGEW